MYVTLLHDSKLKELNVDYGFTLDMKSSLLNKKVLCLFNLTVRS